MHFGRVQSLDDINLSLPEDRQRTLNFLKLPRSHHGQLRIGAPVWASREWVGSFYPEKTAPSHFLPLYAKTFNTVEVNSSFYHHIDPQTIELWCRQVHADFRFCPKMSRDLSHQYLKPLSPRDFQPFFRSLEAFGSHLGITWIQFPETFAASNYHFLERFLKLLPSPFRWAIELRHQSWFSDHMLLNPVIDLFYRHRVSAVITDTPGRRDVLHLSLTQPFVMIRFLGCFPSSSDSQRLKAWARRLKSWQAMNMDDLYFFVHQARHVTIPETTLLMKRLTEFEV